MTSPAAWTLCTGLILTSLSALAAPLAYPPTERGPVTDDYFGTTVADPYRWLEDTDAAPTRAWVEAQNRFSQPLLAALPERAAIRERLRELWNYERYELVQKRAGRYFYRRNDGLQNQSVLYVQDSPAAAPRLLLDPNTLSADGTVALTQYRVSPDGAQLAYGIASSGSDWNEFRVRSVATGADGPDRLTRIKFSTIAWTGDSKGFFYSRYPEAPAGGGSGTFDDLANQGLWYHRIGTPQAEDVLVHADPAHPKWGWQARVTADGRYLVIAVWQGSAGENLIYVKDLGRAAAPALDAPLLRLVPEFKSEYELLGNRGSRLYFRSSEGAPRGRVLAVDLDRPEPRVWKSLIPEQADTLKHALMAGGEIVALYLRDATARLRRYSPEGKFLGDIALPGLGSIPDLSLGGVQLSGDPADPELFYGFASYNQPQTTYRYDLAARKGGVFQPLKLNFRPDDYVTEQVFYRSKDGTRVPMFISYRKGLKRDARTPTLLYGYGGFDVSQTPSFSVPSLVWMERGGIYAVANLRGGGEYGRAWHEAGTQARKQNVFDDFIAAARYLIAEGWTSPAHLAISGRSNGGLLVAATMNQQPDLFAVALPAVGVLDMLRYHRFTIGWAWAGDYGTAETEEGFKYLSAYSPLHTVRPGTKYPAVLITTADHDDRVVPGHSFKYAAALQAAQGGEAPILIRIDVKAGHGADKPIAKQIEEEADRLAFTRFHTRAK